MCRTARDDVVDQDRDVGSPTLDLWHGNLDVEIAVSNLLEHHVGRRRGFSNSSDPLGALAVRADEERPLDVVADPVGEQRRCVDGDGRHAVDLR